jgi:hypothetical protein
VRCFVALLLGLIDRKDAASVEGAASAGTASAVFAMRDYTSRHRLIHRCRHRCRIIVICGSAASRHDGGADATVRKPAIGHLRHVALWDPSTCSKVRGRRAYAITTHALALAEVAPHFESAGEASVVTRSVCRRLGRLKWAQLFGFACATFPRILAVARLILSPVAGATKARRSPHRRCRTAIRISWPVPS